jgi:hypothetical protein
MLPGDFTVSEGHGHPLVIIMQSYKLTTKVAFGKHIFLQPCQFVRSEVIAYQIRSKGRFHCQLM